MYKILRKTVVGNLIVFCKMNMFRCNEYLNPQSNLTSRDLKGN